jgi:hypothetical protein
VIHLRLDGPLPRLRVLCGQPPREGLRRGGGALVRVGGGGLPPPPGGAGVC